MNKIKIFFWGTPAIAIPALQTLAADPNTEIVGIGVMPDRPVGRKQILTPCAVREAAENLNLPIYEINTKDDLLSLPLEEVDLGIVIAFGMIFPSEILKYPLVNVHFSLLPKYRGASPVQSAILRGDKTSGITFQRMVSQLDQGDILLQQEYDITGKNTAQVWDEFSHLTAEILPSFTRDFKAGKIVPHPQEEAQATYCGKFTREDGLIDPKKETAEQIYRKYLAFTPWPGIALPSEKGNIKLLEVSLVATNDSIPLPCLDGTTLFIRTAQIPGSNPTSANKIFQHGEILI